MLYSPCIGGADEQTTKGQSRVVLQNKEPATNLSFGHLDKIMMANKKHSTPSVYVVLIN